jgi:hypothetical protein
LLSRGATRRARAQTQIENRFMRNRIFNSQFFIFIHKS